MTERTIKLTIDAGEKMCDGCEYKTAFHTGLIGEWHMVCDIFPDAKGEWAELNMKRPQECLQSEKRK